MIKTRGISSRRVSKDDGRESFDHSFPNYYLGRLPAPIRSGSYSLELIALERSQLVLSSGSSAIHSARDRRECERAVEKMLGIFVQI